MALTSEQLAALAADSPNGEAPHQPTLGGGGAGVSVVTAIARHKLLVALLAVAFAAAGGALGVSRHPTYTSAATLQVGTVNPNSPGFYGFVQAASDLATSFSRSITAAPVLSEIHSKLGLTESQAANRLSAEPIPLSPSFRVIATGTSPQSAIALANVASEAVTGYEAHVNSTGPQAIRLLNSYKQAAAKQQEASSLVNRLSSSAATRHSTARVQAEASLAAARLHASALGAAYQTALVNQGPSSGLVSLLAGAASASSDRTSKIELLGFTGLLAGLVIGCAVAALYEQRRGSRRTP